MEKHTIEAQPRAVIKKGVKRLRKEGLVPAAIFGYKGNINIQLNAKIFKKVYEAAGHTTIVEVELEGKKHNVLIDEAQINPVTREVSHVSLREVRMDEEITMAIPLELVGSDEAPAVKDENQMIILAVTELEVKGLPGNMPSEIKIDVSKFHAGDTLTLSQVVLPEGVVFVEHAEDVDEDGQPVDPTVATTVSAEISEESPIAEAAAEDAEGEGAEPKAASDDKKEDE